MQHPLHDALPTPQKPNMPACEGLAHPRILSNMLSSKSRALAVRKKLGTRKKLGPEKH